MFFSENIKLLRKRRGRTQDEVADALKMKRSTLSGYENKVAKPNAEAMIAFADYYGVSVDTLLRIDLTITSERVLSQIEQGFDVYVRGGKLRVLATTVDSGNNENIELVPDKAKAGYTRGFADPDFIEKLPVFQLPFLDKSKKYRTFQLNGDSMLPIPDKAWVTGEYIIDWNDIKTGTACIVSMLDEGLVFKVVENKIDEGGVFILHSLNSEYEPYEVAVSQVAEIWQFVHFISHEMPLANTTTDEVLRQIRNIRDDISGLKQKLNVK